MSFARRMRKRQAQLARPIIEITPTDTHIHSAVLKSGRLLRITLDDALEQLGYQNVAKLTPALIEELSNLTELRATHLQEALRLRGVYSYSSDSVLFVADDKWAE